MSTRHWPRALAILSLAASPLSLAGGVVTLDFGIETRDDVRKVRVGTDGRILVEVLTDEVPPNTFCGVYGLDHEGALLSPFGSNGRLSLENRCSSGMLLRPDGSFLVASGQQIDFRNASGALVGDGLHLSLTPYHVGNEIVLAEQPDGKLLVGSTHNSCMSTTCESWVVARYNSDRTLDTSFGVDGIVTLDVSNEGDRVSSVHVLPSNKILISGRTDIGTATSYTTITRLTPDGQVDAMFGANGSVQMAGSLGVTELDSLGRIYVQAPGALKRLSADGSLDGTYSASVASDGSPVILNFAIDAADRAVLFGVRGSLLAGYVEAAYVARFDNSGSFDTSFNGAGSLDLTFPTDLAGKCLGDVDGNLPVIACSVWQMADPGLPTRSDLALVRLTESGLIDTTFGINQPPSDTYPDPFIFAPVSAPYGTAAVTSASVTITGTTAASRISINGPDATVAFSIGCDGTFTSSPGTIAPGAEVCVRMDAANQPGASKWATLLVSGRAATFVVTSTNSPADSIPEAFTFVDQSDVPTGTPITSNLITIQGITGFSTVTVQNGAYSLGCDARGFTTEPTTVSNGATICVRHDSSAAAATAMSTTLSVSGVSDVFTSTTRAATPPASNPASSNSSRSSGGGSMNLTSLAMLAMLGAASRRHGRRLRR